MAKLRNFSVGFAVKTVLDNMPKGTVFHGWMLKKKCVEINPALEEKYVDTFLRNMRLYCSEDYVLEEKIKAKSLYKKVSKAVWEN